jgi:uncharacterized protein (TIGR03437 family)
LLTLTGFVLIGSLTAFGQTPTCSYSAGVPTLNAQGLAEQIGDIFVTCSGGGATTTLLNVEVNGTITNRLDAGGNSTGITFAGGATIGALPQQTAPNRLLFDGVQVGSGSISFSISGIRIAVPSIPASVNAATVTLNVVASALIMTGSPVLAGIAHPALLASVLNYGVPCEGSPLPSTLDFPSLLAAGTRVSTIRVTQSDAGLFLAKSGSADTGTRFLVSLSGYGANAQVYVPDVITGNSTPVPTSAGAFGIPASPGTYSPNNNQFLLARVAGADATGAGGTLFLSTAPVTVQTFNSVTQVPLVNGVGTVTYQVQVAIPGVLNSAQIPVFVVAPATNCPAVQANTLGVSMAPVSNVSVATQTDPIPRFLPVNPPSDCSINGDCGAGYFPVLQVAPGSISLSSSSLGPQQTGYITVTDGGPHATQLDITASANYVVGANQSPANWLSINGTAVKGTTPTRVIGVVDPASGISSFVVSLTADPSALLIPGAYAASVTINAGSAGSVTVPLTFNVGPAGAVIQSLVNAANGQVNANGQPAPVTAGSFAAIYGINLVAKNTLTVTFNGFRAAVSYDGPSGSKSQINVLVPPELGSAATAGVVATVDGVASNLYAIALVPNAPAVFTPGILNQDNTINSGSAPASLGDIVQIFLTGLATPPPSPLTLNIGGQPVDASAIKYAGPVASITGLEQINAQILSGLPPGGNTLPLTLCVPAANGQPICSAPVNLYLH